jgi:y4mF family transcriptional regulator
MNLIAEFVKKRRKQSGLTQEEFAIKAGVALTVIRKIEQGKENLSLSKVNQVLIMFGQVLGPVNARENETDNNKIQ